MPSPKHLLILGAGVSGLSTAILAQRAGYRVTIWARELPPHTTSDKAAAIWYPYLCYPRDKALAWAKATYDFFQREIIPDPASGCHQQTCTELFETPQPEPWWADALPHPIERPAADELPAGYLDAYRFPGIVMDTRIYMAYLLDRVRSAGGEIVQRSVTDISDALDAASQVVNCLGLGARGLLGDERLYPVRGQMLRVQAAGADTILFDDTGRNALALVVPRSGDIMLGGTTQEHDWNTQPDQGDTAAILAKARNLLPGLEDIDIHETIVGLRPVRDEVRVEAERIGDKTLIHNYGHGGAGFTLSWGCAAEVIKLLEGK
jgi:D-amino-acid oxidase